VPLENISKQFKDISLSFLRHPVTNDIASIRNEDAIKKSVMNLVRTRIGERFFNSLLGSDVESSLFELGSNSLTDGLRKELENLLNNFEPRVLVRKIDVDYPADSNQLNITMTYDIIGLPLPQQNITFVLQPTRY
jgi:phage baseplate assembly protein W